MTCGHPKPDTWDTCSICEMVADHEAQPEYCSCVCDLARGANDHERRTEYLEITAENKLYEARRLFEGVGKDEIDLEMTVREMQYAPVYEMHNTELGDRMDALRSMPYSDYLRTPEWLETRRRAHVRAGGLCQACNTADSLETHHRTYERLGREDLDDLIVLCAACHTAVHLVIDARAGKTRRESKRMRV